ncbi:MAG: LacI family transcriptional regulator [Magnetovibrio sp.]|nr:LacI family transcriptional regulator [Magnetovibrio sp.]
MYRLSCITKNKTNPAYEGARIGASRVARQMGCEISHYVPLVPDSIDEQASLIEKALETKPDGILLSPVHPTALDGIIKKITQADIPLVFFVSRSEAVIAKTFVTSDNYKLAVAIASYLLDNLTGNTNIVIVNGSPNSATSKPRTSGFLDAIASRPNTRVVAECCGNYQRKDAKIAMREILLNHANIDAILAANDYMAFGVLDALKEFNQKASLVGINAMPEAIAAIRTGKMEASAAFDAMKIACIATAAAIRILKGLPVPSVIELPVEIVDKSNCHIWDKEYDERPIPDWSATITYG